MMPEVPETGCDDALPAKRELPVLGQDAWRSLLLLSFVLGALIAPPTFAQDQWHDSHSACEMCHTEHFSQSHTWSGAGTVSTTPTPDGDWLGTVGPNPKLLKATPANDDLCIACHGGPPPPPPLTAAPRVASNSASVSSAAPSRSFNGIATWTHSSHGSAPGMAARAAGSRCVVCHNPHGVRDREGMIPSRVRAREPQLCLGCHDGAQAGDIASQLSRPYVHGQQARGRHKGHEGDNPDLFAASPADNRHAACSDCHNSHEAFRDPAPPASAEASSRLAAVSRVEVVNGGAGVVPTYRWHGADDPGVVNEYEVCFKCHSSWTRQPAGQPDLALLTNPANASVHPIQDRGRDANIDPASFAGGASAESIVRCSDCHSSDDPQSRGPHGSNYPHLLKKPSPVAPERPGRGDLCFDCHAWEVYGDAAAGPELQRASRFNAPSAVAGHAYHVGVMGIPCFSCHESHGSVASPALIATGRQAGITSYQQTGEGGSCTADCHSRKTYAVNYQR